MGVQGVGRIVAIGAHTQDSPVKVGDRVGIKWLAYSCLDCEPCRKGLEQSVFFPTLSPKPFSDARASLLPQAV